MAIVSGVPNFRIFTVKSIQYMPICKPGRPSVRLSVAPKFNIRQQVCVINSFQSLQGINLTLRTDDTSILKKKKNDKLRHFRHSRF